MYGSGSGKGDEANVAPSEAKKRKGDDYPGLATRFKGKGQNRATG